MVKIYLNKELGIKKPFDVKRINKRVEAAYSFQLEGARFELLVEEVQNRTKNIDEKAEADMSEEEQKELRDEVINFYEKQRDHLRNMMNYIIETVGLNKKQSELLEELEVDETSVLAGKIASIMMGANPDELEENPGPED